MSGNTQAITVANAVGGVEFHANAFNGLIEHMRDCLPCFSPGAGKYADDALESMRGLYRELKRTEKAAQLAMHEDAIKTLQGGAA